MVVSDRARDLLDPGDRRRRHGLRRLGRRLLLRARPRRRAGAGASRTGGIIDAAAALGAPRQARRFPITIGSGDETLYQLRSDDRRLSRKQRIRWRYRTDLAPATGQLVNWWEGNVAYGPDGDLYVGNTGGGAYSLTPGGEQRWVDAARELGLDDAGLRRRGQQLLGLGRPLRLLARPERAAALADAVTAGYVTSSPALGSDGTVYVGSFDGSLLRARPATAARALELPDRRPHLQLAGARERRARRDEAIYIGSADGSVYAVAPRRQPDLAL